MSRKFLVLSALALGLIVPASAKVYTRDEAIKTAMENSSDIKSAEEDLVSANSQVDAGYGNAYPSIDLNATVTRIFGLDDVKKNNRPYGCRQRYGRQKGRRRIPQSKRF